MNNQKTLIASLLAVAAMFALSFGLWCIVPGGAPAGGFWHLGDGVIVSGTGTQIPILMPFVALVLIPVFYALAGVLPKLIADAAAVKTIRGVWLAMVCVLLIVHVVIVYEAWPPTPTLAKIGDAAVGIGSFLVIVLILISYLSGPWQRLKRLMAHEHSLSVVTENSGRGYLFDVIYCWTCNNKWHLTGDPVDSERRMLHGEKLPSSLSKSDRARVLLQHGLKKEKLTREQFDKLSILSAYDPGAVLKMFGIDW
jgi:hypothetical protein